MTKLRSGGRSRIVAAAVFCAAFNDAGADTLPEVSVTQGVAQTSEAGGAPATFTFSRTGSTAQQLLVYFEPAAGSEVEGNDWSSDEIGNLGGRQGIIFPVGVHTYEAAITADQDNRVEGPESLLQRFMPRSTYTIASGSDGVFETVLLDDPPEVSIDLAPDTITEGSTPGSMSLTRIRGDTTLPLGVQIFLNAGSAAIGADFTVEGLTSTSSRLVIIPAGETTETRSIFPGNDNELEGDESITIEVRPSTSASSDYIIVGASDTITLSDDVARLGITALDPDASESGDPGIFRISRTGGDLDTQLFVYLDRSGTAAAPGQVPRDYDMDLSQNAIGRFILLPAQASTFDVVVTPLFDTDEGEDDETVVLTIRDDVGDYLVDSAQKSAVVTIENLPLLMLSDGFEAPEP